MASRRKFLAIRLITTLFALFGVISVVFVIFRLVPGDPASMFISPGMPPEAAELLRKQYGLDDPIHIQYIKYMEALVGGNLGYSFMQNRPVTGILYRRVAISLSYMLPALFVAYVVGPFIGAYMAWHRGETIDTIGIGASLMFYSAPIFWTGMVIVMVFSFQLGWLPSGGMHSILYSGPQSVPETFFNMDFVRHWILPFSLTAVYYTTVPLVYMRNTMIDVLGDDFIEMNKAEGLSELAILYRHAARNALLPILHRLALSVGYAMGGSILIETVFSWPGIGRLMWQAVQARDYPLAQGAFILMAVAIIVFNFIVDLVSVTVDPRVADKET